VALARGAVCEMRSNLQPLPSVDLVAIAIDIGAEVAIGALDADDLPPDWRTYPAPPALAVFGDGWIRERRTAVLSIPSVIVTVERNFVINPAHPDVARLTAHPPQPFSLDPRFWKR
jgi:RES domain-containing protein